MNEKFSETYGVPRDIFARVKMIGLLIADLFFVGTCTLFAFRYGLKIFPKQQWIQMLLWVLVSSFTALYLVPPTNGGKANWKTIYLYFRRRRRRYISIDYQEKRGK